MPKSKKKTSGDSSRSNHNVEDDEGFESPLLVFKQDGLLMGLSGKDLIDYIEGRRKEAAEEKKRREEQDFILRKMQLSADLGMQDYNENAHHSASNGSTNSSRDKPKMKLPFLDDKDDVEAYFRQFERAAKISGWSEDEWAARLGCLLKGKAREAYTQLPDEEAEEYDCVKTAILRRFQLTAEAYRRKFRGAKKEPSEKSKEYLTRLDLFVTRWVELSKREGRTTDMRELVLLEKFLEGLPADQARFVRERDPVDTADAVKSASLFEEARESEGRRSQGGPSFNRGPKEDHPQVQSNHSDRNHANRSKDKQHFPPRRPTPPPHGGATRGCFLCGGSHLARNCTKNNRASQEATSVILSVAVEGKPSPLCQSCRHLDFNPQCQVKVNGQEAKAIRDTGASTIIVDRRLVPSDSYTGEVRTVTLAQETATSSMPMARVHMETPFFQGDTEVIAMVNPVHSVLIGNTRKNGEGKEEKVPLFPVVETCAPVQTRAQEAAENKAPTQPEPRVKIIDVKPEELKREQQTDPSLAKAREIADKKGNKDTLYTWSKGILYRTYKSDQKSFKQVVVPQRFRNEVLKLGHDSPMAGHLGGKKTRDRIWRDFYWPGICGDVRRYCASCDACQRSTPKGATRKVPLQAMPLASTPFEKVGVDIVGPILPASEKGNRYILTLVDYATRYAEATALKNIRAETVAEALVEMFTRYGVPKEIVTDQGTQFTGEIMQQLTRLLAMKSLRTSPYHPQTNGLCEKFNSTLKNTLKRMCQEQPKLWDRFIPALLFAYREVPQESLQFSPFELLYGREVRGPMQILRQIWTDDDVEEEVRSTAEYIVDLSNRIEQTCSIARENLSKASKRYARVYNKKTRLRTFHQGDKVLLLLPEKHNKLQLTWKGPFVINEKTSDCNYKVNVGKKVKIYHANLLKAYLEREEVKDEVAVVMENTGPDMEPYITDHIPLLPLQATESYKDVKVNPDLDSTKVFQLTELAKRHQKCLTDLPGMTQLQECELKLTTQKPVYVKPYPLPHSQVETVKEEVRKMLKMGVIEPSVSPYNAPVVLTKKKDDSIRFCIDFRRLNQVTEFDSEKLPDIDYLFSKLSKARYFSKVDLSKGYWQLRMREQDKPKTTFNTPLGSFQWVTMPFGLKNAGATFTRMMRKLVAEIDRDDVDNFMDDILIATEDWEQHLQAIEAVFTKLEKAGLTAKPSKCFLGFEQLEYLGHRVGHGSIQPEEDKVTKLANAEPPKTKKELRAFLGLAGYYRKFVPNFAGIGTPLTDATKKGHPDKLVWTQEMQSAFQSLKDVLTSKPVMLLPDNDKPFVLRTDASDYAIGAVLMQDNGKGLQPVAYASRKLNKAERNYATIEKECLAAVWAVKKYEPYLYAVHFTLETDHQPLQYLRKSKTENGRLMRWAIQLQQYSFTVKVIKGVDNVGADYMSRSICVNMD
ncbi:uncharacterized protein [Littorina saxatilis]|uniref:uncharacterized protein n=1 Tax=Littorina saxatilis TaxID=31220 RepID=UPI0038B6A1B7